MEPKSKSHGVPPEAIGAATGASAQDYPYRAYLSLGANLGDRLAYLVRALAALNSAPVAAITKISNVYETEPVGKRDQPLFLNLAAEISTGLEPLSLLRNLQEIENRLGRVRVERWGTRTIDMDILCMDHVAFWQDEQLVLPHPRLKERLFVLKPLAEIAPNCFIPGFGLTVEQLLTACSDNHSVRYYLSATNIWQRIQGANL